MTKCKGRVYKSTGSWYKVKTEHEGFWNCRLKGKLKLKTSVATNPIAVGDWVEVEPEIGQPQHGLITQVLPRDNYLIRKSVHKNHQAHILASNLDQVLVIASLIFPRTSLGFIDRILVAAESYGIAAGVVFNKMDLLSEDELEYARQLAEMYRSIGYKAILTSVVENQGIAQFGELLEHKTTLICGHSGVGKSSLLNTLNPDWNLSTGQVSTFAQKGTHTTTYAEMFDLTEDTHIMDTPGIKEIGLMEMENENLSRYFPEMRAISDQCKFYNCSHMHEPGCAVREAVEKGKLPLTRFQSYLSMLENDDNRR